MVTKSLRDNPDDMIFLTQDVMFQTSQFKHKMKSNVRVKSKVKQEVCQKRVEKVIYTRVVNEHVVS